MRIVQEAKTFDDVLLLPAYSEVVPAEVDLTTRLTREIVLPIPLVSAAMDTVTEARLAIAMAQEGGIGIVHKNMSIEQQAAEVKKVKKYASGVVQDPITITPETTVQALLDITRAHKISGLPVVDGVNLVGIVTSRDVRFETNLSQPVANIMTPKDKLVTVKEDASREQVIELLHQHRIEKLLVVNDSFHLRGMITVRDIQNAHENPYACIDDQGRLRVGAAIGTSEKDKARAEALLAANVDVLVVDTAHGHSTRVLQQIRWLRQQYPHVQIIGGNIATGAAALALKEAGVDAVKVGIGPGSICTTRIVAAVGVPQITAISNVATALQDSGIPIIADGGVRFSGDIAKAIAAGAYAIMIGGLLAGTEESPGEVELFQGRTYKSYRGMGSIGAMGKQHGSSDRYFQDNTGKAEKLVPEGIEGRVPYKGALAAVVHQLMGGLRASMGYTGSPDIDTMRTKPEFIEVSHAGVSEGHVHDVHITKEAPNYQREK